MEWNQGGVFLLRLSFSQPSSLEIENDGKRRGREGEGVTTDAGTRLYVCMCLSVCV